jgi:hypothetical protein
MMQEWLQSTAVAQDQKASQRHTSLIKNPRFSQQQEISGTSDASCRGNDKFPSPLCFPPTPKSLPPPLTRVGCNKLPFNIGNGFMLNPDHKSEEESETNHDSRPSDWKCSELSGITSAAIASLMDASTDASSYPASIPLDPSRIRQSTVGEVLSMGLLRQQGPSDSPACSGTVHFTDLPLFSPKTPPLQPLMAVPAQSITSSTAMDCIRAHSKATGNQQQLEDQNISVSMSQLQELVKAAVDEQMRRQAPAQNSQQPPVWWQQLQQQSLPRLSTPSPAMSQISKLLESLQEYRQQQGVFRM